MTPTDICLRERDGCMFSSTSERSCYWPSTTSPPFLKYNLFFEIVGFLVACQKCCNVVASIVTSYDLDYFTRPRTTAGPWNSNHSTKTPEIKRIDLGSLCFPDVLCFTHMHYHCKHIRFPNSVDSPAF